VFLDRDGLGLKAGIHRSVSSPVTGGAAGGPVAIGRLGDERMPTDGGRDDNVRSDRFHRRGAPAGPADGQVELADWQAAGHTSDDGARSRRGGRGHLRRDDVVDGARRRRAVRLDPRARLGMAAARRLVESLAAAAEPGYGVSTDFGSLAVQSVPRRWPTGRCMGWAAGRGARPRCPRRPGRMGRHPTGGAGVSDRYRPRCPDCAQWRRRRRVTRVKTCDERHRTAAKLRFSTGRGID